MNVLVACEFSGVVRDAFIEKGHNAWSCDLLPAEGKYKHRSYMCNVLDLLTPAFSWDLMIAHPPCTYLTNAGVRHLHENVTSCNGVRAKIYGQQRRELMYEAAEFFNLLFKNPLVDKICVENPIPHKYAREIIGKYNQIIQPWQFGHGDTKATCLWLKNLPPLIHTDIVGGRNHPIMNLPPSPDRGKKRSITYTGIAKAMADQWG